MIGYRVSMKNKRLALAFVAGALGVGGLEWVQEVAPQIMAGLVTGFFFCGCILAAILIWAIPKAEDRKRPAFLSAMFFSWGGFISSSLLLFFWAIRPVP
jgi:hypothetical protein